MKFEYAGNVTLEDGFHSGSEHFKLDDLPTRSPTLEGAIQEHLKEEHGFDWEVVGHERGGAPLRRADLGKLRITVERIAE